MSANYDVEEILESRKKGNKVEYLVRWAPSWETEKNLNCPKLLREFKQKSGETDDKNGEKDGEDDDHNEETDDDKPSPAKRGAPRKAATAANKKRKATQKKTTKRRRR